MLVWNWRFWVQVLSSPDLYFLFETHLWSVAGTLEDLVRGGRTSPYCGDLGGV